MLTGTLTKDQVQAVIKLAFDAKWQRRPEFTWDLCRERTQVGESRAWLIVRRVEIDRHTPELLVDVDALNKAHMAELKAAGRESEFNELDVLSPIVKDLYLERKCSWGEIMVRLDRPEGLVRKAFRHNTIVKDRGQRIGKGGRFAYGAGHLYTEHRRGEGIAIPVDLRGRPEDVSQLLNGERRLDHKKVLGAPSKGKAKRARAGKATKATTPEPVQAPEPAPESEQAE